MTNILVTGANGQVGCSISSKGHDYPFNIYALNRKEIDITSASSIKDAMDRLKPSLVINCAAYTAVELAEQNKTEAFVVNDKAALLLSDACRMADIPIFHISTDYVFDGLLQAAYTETDEAKPLNVYGLSKLAGEKTIQRIWERHLIIRTSWVFSKTGNNFVKTMLRLSSQHEKLDIVADQISAPTSANSLADTLLLLAQKFVEEGELDWGIYHYTNHPYCSWYDFAEEIFKQSKQKGLIARAPQLMKVTSEQFSTAVRRPLCSSLDCRKIDHYLENCLQDWRIELSHVLESLAEHTP